MACFAPVLLLGSVLTLHPNLSHPTSLNGPVLEVQSCEDGLGANLKVSTSTASLGAQYGLMVWQSGPWSATFTPNVGVGYLYDRVPELSGQVNFSLGASLMVGYDRWRVATEYWHQSNAFLGSVNAGVDMLLIMGGVRF